MRCAERISLHHHDRRIGTKSQQSLGEKQRKKPPKKQNFEKGSFSKSPLRKKGKTELQWKEAEREGENRE